MTPRFGIALIVLAAALGGCAATSPPATPPEIGYLPPTGLPPMPRSALVQQQPFLVFGNVADRLQQSPFTITHLDEQGGVLVAQYSGDPEPYVDCGWIVAYQAGELDPVPAAKASADFEHWIDDRPLKVAREFRLDGRMVVTLEPEGGDTVVNAETTYVLTKTVDAAGPNGQPSGRARETIAFKTGESGTFTKGTVCQPNGRFERVLLDSLPATTITGPRRRGPILASGTADALEAKVMATTRALSCASVDAEFGYGNNVRLSGYVESERDAERLREALGQIAGIGTIETDLEIQPWPFCELLEVTRPYQSAGSSDQLPLSVVTSSRATALREGDDLTLDITLPPDAAYLYLGYVQSDGRVGYITTMPVRQWAQDTGAIRFETGYQISPPFGREMIVAVSSARPLFDQPRPAYEPADQYIATLRERLAELKASDPDAAIAASHLIITTEARGAS